MLKLECSFSSFQFSDKGLWDSGCLFMNLNKSHRDDPSMLYDIIHKFSCWLCLVRMATIGFLQNIDDRVTLWRCPLGTLDSLPLYPYAYAYATTRGH